MQGWQTGRLADWQTGRLATIGDGKLPTEKDQNTNEIRAEFLRSLILTERESIDQKGVQFQGAYVSGSFDFESCETNLPFWFWRSFFEEEIVFMRSRIRMLSLSGSEASKGINANEFKCEDSVFLKDGFNAKGQVNFVGAQIGSNLECTKGTFENPNGDALTCNGAEIKGGVFLTDGFNAKGKVDFGSAQIGSVLVCTNGTFENPNGDALNCDSAKIESNVFLRDGFNAKGIVNFAATQIGGSLVCTNAKIDGGCRPRYFARPHGLVCTNAKIDGVFDLDSAKAKDLRDSEGFWSYEGLKNISLDGFVYGHIHDDFQAEKRKKWLAKMPKFKPQPYKQLAKVLRDMGHINDANEIMIEYHDKRSKEFKSGLKKSFFWFYRSFSDYGYSPSKVVKWMFWVWLVCSIVYWHAANTGVFAPSNPIVFQNVGYEYNCSPKEVGFRDIIYKEENGSKNWYYSSLKGEYTTFQPFLYSLDVILPVVDLYMEKDWGVYIPPPSGYFDWLDPSTITFNHIVRLIVWLEILFGWTLSLILVAILSGLAKNEKD